MPETWTVTPTADNPRSFESLLSSIGESTCSINPHERRGEMQGILDIIVAGKTDDERADIRWNLERLGLRRITDQERQVLAQGILLPREAPSLPESLSTLDTEALQRLEGEGGIVRD